MRIGIISENYDHDSKALKALLSQHSFKEEEQIIEVLFIPIGKNIEGDQLLGIKTSRIINIECKKKNINLVILAKDLDALPSNHKKIKKLSEKIQQLATKIDHHLLPFIIIYEQEALILADIQTFNNIYGTSSSFKGNPQKQSEPKEFLKRITAKSNRKYKVSDTPEIFQQLNIQTVLKNHSGDNSFQSFIKKLEEKLK